MNNQAIIENMLDMWLSQKQLEKIKKGWNAFYNDPLKYEGTIVVDMVRLDVRGGGIIMDKQELKKELLERYGDVVSHGHPALQNATPDKQLKMYPIMQFIREICFYS